MAHPALILVPVGLVAYLLGTLEQRVLYFPDRQIAYTPQNLRLPFEDVDLKTTDGVAIHGWYIPAARSTAPVVLFFHGNAGNISHRLGKAQEFHKRGWGVFLLDYRGYGKSKGKPSEKGTYKDAEAAYRYLTETRKMAPKKIVVYGESLGSAVAVEMARASPAGAVILEAPFTSTIDMGKRVYPWLPVRWMVKYRYDSLSKISSLRVPILIMHSPTDEIVPVDMGRQLYAAAAEPKTFFELEGGHNDSFDETGARVYDMIAVFLKDMGVD